MAVFITGGQAGVRVNYVGWLRCSGTQYINTEYSPKSENVEYEYGWIEPTLNSSCTLFGSTNTNYSAGSNRWSGAHYKPSTTSMYSATGITDNRCAIANIAAGAENHATTVINNGTITRTQNGTTATDSYSGTIQNGVNIGLFADIRNSDVIEVCKDVKLLYWRMKDNGVLVREMWPCYDPDGVPAMYDRVEGKYHYNAGTGDFEAGSDEESGDSGKITFTIAGVSYQAEVGMTWVEWVNSSYNTDSFVYAATLDWVYTKTGLNVWYNGSLVYKTAAIIANAAYTTG